MGERDGKPDHAGTTERYHALQSWLLWYSPCLLRAPRVTVQHRLDTWDVQVQRGRTGARALVTVLNDARALRGSVIEHDFIGSKTPGSFEEVQGA